MIDDEARPALGCAGHCAGCDVCPPEVVAFRAELGIDDAEPVEGELLDVGEDSLPAPTVERAFSLGYSVGRGSVQAEAAAAAIFRRARRRRLVLDAVAVGAGWFLGSWIADGVTR